MENWKKSFLAEVEGVAFFPKKGKIYNKDTINIFCHVCIEFKYSILGQKRC